MQGDFQGRSRRNCTHFICKDQQIPPTDCNYMTLFCKRKDEGKRLPAILSFSMKWNLHFLGERGKKKRTWFMSLWRTWRKQEGKKGGFSSASFETRQVALLNKQGLHKYTDNNLKLHKQISIPLAESRKACLETTPAALIALVLQSRPIKARAMTDRCDKSFWLAFWGTSHCIWKLFQTAPRVM